PPPARRHRVGERVRRAGRGCARVSPSARRRLAPLRRARLLSRRPLLVGDQAVPGELSARLLEGDVARRQDHVRLDELVSVDRVAVARDDLEHLAPELPEAGLVALLHGTYRSVVELVETLRVLVRQVELALARDADDPA